jgi:uncharacterized lipoprotein YajG
VKKLIIIALVFSLAGCFMQSKMTTTLPITLPNGQTTVISVTITRPPFASTAWAYNPTSGLITYGVNTSPAVSQAIQDLGTLAAIGSAVAVKAPQQNPGPYKYNAPESGK